MAADYLHNHSQFDSLLRILEEETGILAGLIEKDYWITQVLYGLKKQGFHFELKGGTSLSKGYGIIHRFSEDIDIHIKAPAKLKVDDNPSNNSKANIKARELFYDWLAVNIKIDGIISVERDRAFDDPMKKFRSGGIRLGYKTYSSNIEGVKDGILLEAGFDTVTPNHAVTISSWAFERSRGLPELEIVDHRAIDIACYHPGYTLVEKLQTIATKFRQEQTDGKERPNYMRQYYDVFCLLKNEEVQKFIGTPNYYEHKLIRFPKQEHDIPIAENQAFLLQTGDLRKRFKERYESTKSLYYKGQPPFEELLERIIKFSDRL